MYKINFGASKFRLDLISPTEMDWSTIDANNVDEFVRDIVHTNIAMADGAFVNLPVSLVELD